MELGGGGGGKGMMVIMSTGSGVLNLDLGVRARLLSTVLM